MVASPSELSLDCKQPQSYSMLLKSIAVDNNISSSCGSAHQPPFIIDHLQSQKLEEYLSRLEEERLKIDAFKRELPLCMQLLTNAMEASRQQLQSYKATSGTQGKRPILEEFIPIKHTNSEGSSDQQKPPNSTSDKANWMTSAQLWSQANEGATTKQSASLATSKESEMGLNPNLSLLDINDNKNNQRDGGAFLPFTKERSSNPINHIVLPDLALTSDEKEADDKKCLRNESGFTSENSALNGKVMDTATQTNVTGSTTASQTNRKQRRCWSPDLHRRFVNALQMLGGSQVATPKQIRELMKVDGLTNDEVKSHLQKYRLHTRRPGPNPQPAGAPGPQLVVLGGIWVPPEYSTAASAAAHHHVGQPHAIYSTHPAQHYFPPAIPQAEFYPPPLSHALPQLHHHPSHQIHIYKASPQRRSSPESDGGRGARDRSESIEDEKSESSSWKGDSGEESNGERKRKKLASMREGEEESNGSDITLKF